MRQILEQGCIYPCRGMVKSEGLKKPPLRKLEKNHAQERQPVSQEHSFPDDQ